MTEQTPYIVTLDLTRADRYAILVNALQDYAHTALDNAESDGASAAERDDFQATAATARDLLREVTGE